ncbi:hypothetical protein [Arthrobacter sp. UM1]|uniref:hypothetical protein n=1 Tax=Arthrobacter sp. UM1 TaxID=2766776 RepID=UPI001CF63169|nr:hypothetical protein [Arthrobacter sp. UM1]MCB4208998.1 hypothetical protein [Arthrobacter sp. UM1]
MNNEALNRVLAEKGLQLRALDEDHCLEAFDCGQDPRMTDWFCSTAHRWQQEDLCRVWVISPLDNESKPLGFFTLSAAQIIPAQVARSERAAHSANRPWANALQGAFPALLLGKFALDQDVQGSGLGAMLMLGAFAKHVQASDAAGIKFLILNVREERLVSYYCTEYGFIASTSTATDPVRTASQSSRRRQSVTPIEKKSISTPLYRSTAAIRADLNAVLEP